MNAGHDLQIFMRPPALDLASAVLPAARIEKISEDPYARLLRFRRNPFASEVKKIARFAPDLLVIALFQHSFFDEICLSKIPKRLRVVGFRSTDAFWGTQANTAPQELAERFDTWVEVSAGIPELEKNRLLASAILGSPVPRKPARISPPQDSNRRCPIDSSGARNQRRRILGRVCRFPSRSWRSRIGAKRIGLQR